jgi:glycosyltransferase involved in cell wall biosynthesis
MKNNQKKLLLLFQWAGGGIPEVYRSLIRENAFKDWSIQQAIFEYVPKSKYEYFNSIGDFICSGNKVSVKYLWLLRKKMKEADLLVANSIICLLSILFLKVGSIPIVFHIHGEYPYIMGDGGLLNIIKRKLFRFLCSTLNVKLVLCVNQSIQKRLVFIDVTTQSLVIENGSTKPKISIKSAAYRLNSKTIIGIGRLDTEKAFDRFIDIANLIILKDESVQFHIFGEGVLKKELECRIEELRLENNIHLKGYTIEPLNEMNKCSLLLMTSKCEGGPIVFPEALSVGLPIVSTPVGLARYFFKGLECVNVHDNNEMLAQSILNVLNMTVLDYENQMSYGLDFFSNNMIIDNKVALYEDAFLIYKE